MYRPLPDCLTIKDSKIQGLGLFATMIIKAKTNLGLTHIYNEAHEDNYIRTPLGEELTAKYTLYNPELVM